MQILVFSSAQMKDEFEKTYSIATQNHDPKLVWSVSDINMGAVYKLRAVLDSEGQYVPIIRCGFTGRELVELDPVSSITDAIGLCKTHLASLISKSLYN